MKKLNFKFVLLSLMLVTLFVSCDKEDDVISTPVVVGAPYAAELLGEPFVFVELGGEIPADEGAYFLDSIYGFEGGADSIFLAEPTNIADIDFTTPGVKNLVYRAYNARGYSLSVNRIIIVYEPNPTPNLTDISGQYARSTNGVIANIGKIADGLYYTDDVGGVGFGPYNSSPVLIYFNEDGSIRMPRQAGPCATIEGSNESIDLNEPITIRYVLLDGPTCFGTAVRTFIKQ